MKATVQHEKYGEIVYKESFWTGKKYLSINGIALQGVSEKNSKKLSLKEKLVEQFKKEFEMQNGKIATAMGEYFVGAYLVIDGETIRITPKVQWYEIVLALIPLIFIIWGNSTAFCKHIPIMGGAMGGGIDPLLGGAIGGGIIGALCAIQFFIIRSAKPTWLKIVIGIIGTVITFIILWLVAGAILGTF